MLVMSDEGYRVKGDENASFQNRQKTAQLRNTQRSGESWRINSIACLKATEAQHESLGT